MTIFKKDPRSPEVVEHLKKDGKVLIEVTTTRLYLVDHMVPEHREQLFHEWFVKFKGTSHAWRDGSHIGGADRVLSYKILTEDGKEIKLDQG